MSTTTSEDLFAEGLERQTARRQLTQLLGKDTVASLHRRSNLFGWWAISSVWLVIGTAMAAIVWAQQQPLWVAVPVTILAILFIAGRQLGMAILMHEASHRSLFENVWLNDNLTNWLCGHPIFLEVGKYRKHHFIHHAKTGTFEDIDYSLIRGFPTTKASLARKFSRDLLGLTGIKSLFGMVLMNAGVLKWTVASDIEKLPREGRTIRDYTGQFFREAWPTLLTNALLFAILATVGHPELYLAWLVAYLSPYWLFIRIRAIAEHALTEMTPDMLKNTRSTRPSFWSRSFVAPFHVNYHIEHHALASAPCWQLPRLHRLLREKNAVPEPPGYLEVLGRVSSRV
ncbi:fatty acid desaturase family protein [Pseudomaricurvus alkylphenolicus]|uniref:fatty acid desaturase family protein n=1 Tax=Pseudomaricurvus alkylphenolicus TaxID=1306991 RepID=UPI00141EFACD|nr:fatty acid desaturase family protein [Pseudomaricurvus alkylphenolicus]NIB42699.1 fatty acid desaturase family protein [Pseudomaricurvus alkylphenolicus]